MQQKFRHSTNYSTNHIHRTALQLRLQSLMGLIVRTVEECWNLCRTGFLAGSSRYKKFSALPDFHNIFPPFLQTIDYSSPRGGISVETNTSGNIPTSYLLIDSVAPSDSGKYTCRPANAGEISVNVHIQDGK